MAVNIKLKEEFTRLWQQFFNGADLPITFYYTDETGHAEMAEPGKVNRCVIGALVDVRKGRSYTFGADSIGCFGGKKYLGFSENLAPNFEYFLSCGLQGKVEGERYKKTPAMVKNLLQRWPKFKAPARYIVFKRWDKLEETDSPQVAVFFAKPDALSGLYTLANYDTSDPNGAIIPMGSGCSSIIQNPYLEKDSDYPRAIIGMFDPSARPFVATDELTFSVPIGKLATMLGNMEGSFLITKTWKAMQGRIEKYSR